MRVIKKGPAKDWKRECTCHCGAVLEVERADCRFVFDQRDGNYWQAACPECNRPVTIAESLVGGP